MLAAVALTGCGGGDKQPARATPTPTGVPPTLALADCDQWHEMSQASRRGLVEQMSIFFGGRVNGNYGYGKTLTQQQAFTVLTNGCKPSFAGAIKLYKLYGRAAAFTP